MRKILIIILCYLMCAVNVNATSIEEIYIDSEIEIAGGLYIKQIISVKDQNEDLKIKLYQKDNSLKKFNNDEESLYSSDIYNPSGAKLFKVGIVKEDVNINEYNNDDFYDNNVSEIEYEVEEDNNSYIIVFPKTNEDVIYYLEYTVLNILVEHNDSAEFYYRYIDNFGYDVKSIDIITTLPYSSELFKVWAHGSKNMKVSLDSKRSIVHSEIINYKKDEYLDNRILFDKGLFAININEHKKSNMDAIELIEKIENERLNNTKNNNILKIALVISLSLLILSIVVYFIYTKFKKTKNC